MPFNIKEWLDSHVVPLVEDKPLAIHSFIWNGNPPKEVLVWLKTTPDGSTVDAPDSDLDPQRWAASVKELLEAGFRFDYLREQMLITLQEGVVKAFGSDGAPIFNQEGMASVRLFRKEADDGTGLIVQVGCQFWPVEGMTAGTHASAAVKGFFGLFDSENPLEVCTKYGAIFGQA